VAEFLLRCGAIPLDVVAAPAEDAVVPEPVLL
jgi:hypothetical protein